MVCLTCTVAFVAGELRPETAHFTPLMVSGAKMNSSGEEIDLPAVEVREINSLLIIIISEKVSIISDKPNPRKLFLLIYNMKGRFTRLILCRCFH